VVDADHASPWRPQPSRALASASLNLCLGFGRVWPSEANDARRAAYPRCVSIAIVIAAFNRLHLLRKCVERVALRTSEATREILIWDNASDAETVAYLNSLTDPRIRVVRSPTNIGQNAYAHAFPLTKADHLIQLDDDVIDAPRGWDGVLLDAFAHLPKIGYLAANIVDDGHSIACDILYRQTRHLYTPRVVNGVRVLAGPTGGWCTMTSREIHDEVGGYALSKRQVYWLADEAYIRRIHKHGYEAAILDELKVFHANGPYYSDDLPEKRRYWDSYVRAQARKDAVKRALLRIPFGRRLNARYGFFVEPTV
jgi:GT2 family glycosyltransferase